MYPGVGGMGNVRPDGCFSIPAPKIFSKSFISGIFRGSGSASALSVQIPLSIRLERDWELPSAPPPQELSRRAPEGSENREVSKGVLKESLNNCVVSGENAEKSVSHEVSRDCIDVGSEKSGVCAVRSTTGTEFEFEASTSLNMTASSEMKSDSRGKSNGKGLPNRWCERAMIEKAQTKERIIGPRPLERSGAGVLYLCMRKRTERENTAC